MTNDDDRPRAFNSTLRRGTKGLKRSPLKSRGKPLRQGKLLGRSGKRMRRLSLKKARERRNGTAEKYGAHHCYVRDNFTCVLEGHPDHQCWQPWDAPYPIDSHHVDPKRGDAANCVPACRRAHDIFHALGCNNARILRIWRVDLAAIAADIWARAGGPLP